MAKQTEKQIRNVEYVNGMATAIAEAEALELASAQSAANELKAGEKSLDEKERLEKLEAHYAGRAEWIAKFTGVTPNEFDLLKQAGIEERYIAQVAADKYAVAKAVDLFKALANLDWDLIEDAPLVCYLKELLVEHETNATVEFDNGNMGRAIKSTLGHSTTRQHDMVRNMLNRLGVIKRYRADGSEIAFNATARGIDHVTIDTKSKAWKRIVKVFAKA